MNKLPFSVRDVVEQRVSVRTYEKKALPQPVRDDLLAYAAGLENPLGPKIRLQWIEEDAQAGGEKLGTYGVIKNAGLYLGVTVPDAPYAAEALGYAFEHVVLYAQSLGLGTCWLGGTFDRAAFAAKMDIREGERFPILSPVGYPAEKPRLPEQLFRRTLGADRRLPWETLFFRDDWAHPLSRDPAGRYTFPLEMARLAPSAVNKQPWRAVVEGGAVHFFEKRSLDSQAGGLDLQRIDVGIAVCHFHLAALERGLAGRFERRNPDLPLPPDVTYVVSWREA